MTEIARIAAEVLSPGAMMQLEHPPYHVLIANVGGVLYAIEDACPHSGLSLCEGSLEDTVVTCPGHGWEIDVTTGAVITAVGSGSSNPMYEVRREGDEIVVYGGP